MQMLGRAARGVGLGACPCVESQREGSRGIQIISGERGIDAAAQEHPDRHIG
jgi:hypothetical protein